MFSIERSSMHMKTNKHTQCRQTGHTKWTEKWPRQVESIKNKREKATKTNKLNYRVIQCIQKTWKNRNGSVPTAASKNEHMTERAQWPINQNNPIKTKQNVQCCMIWAGSLPPNRFRPAAISLTDFFSCSAAPVKYLQWVQLCFTKKKKSSNGQRRQTLF